MNTGAAIIIQLMAEHQALLEQKRVPDLIIAELQDTLRFLREELRDYTTPEEYRLLTMQVKGTA
jgi:hypothetical protein